jgi:DUF2911 family protein
MQKTYSKIRGYSRREREIYKRYTGRRDAADKRLGSIPHLRRNVRQCAILFERIPTMNIRWTCAWTAIALAALGVAETKRGMVETATINGKKLSISYSSPAVNNRAGKLFGKDGTIGQDGTYPVWRAGANEATAFHTDADLTVGTLAVPKGDYTLYVNLANPAAWELIINKQTGQFGTDYDAKQDLGRVKMTMSKPPAPVEQLKYTLKSTGGNKGTLTLAWENVSASVPLTVK